MRAALDQIVRSQLDRGGAVAAVSCYDAVTASGVIDGATAVGSPVALLVPPATAARDYGQRLIRCLRALADDAEVPVSVQLDHAKDLDLIHRSVESGVDAVLVDGAHLPYAENASFVAAAAASLEGHDVVLEAELGRIDGNEDVAALLASGSADLTDAQEAEEFVKRSGVSLLAVSVGNVHGHYGGPPRIDHDRLTAIGERCPVPLVMHGASGLPLADLRRAVRAGVGKVNVNTELRGVVLESLSDTVPRARESGLDLDAVVRTWSRDVSRQASAVVRGLAGAGVEAGA